MGESVGRDTGAEGGRGRYLAERAASGRYMWRLKAPNGRTVAVSSPQYRTLEDAARAFAALGSDSSGLLARIAHVREGIGWVWLIPGPQGQPLARSARAYERYASCQNAFRRFIALLETETPPQAAAHGVDVPHA